MRFNECVDREAEEVITSCALYDKVLTYLSHSNQLRRRMRHAFLKLQKRNICARVMTSVFRHTILADLDGQTLEHVCVGSLGTRSVHNLNETMTKKRKILPSTTDVDGFVPGKELAR